MDISAFKGICAKVKYDFQHLQKLSRYDVVAQIAADIQAGRLERDARNCLYVYELSDGNQPTTSLIAQMHSDMFTSQRIRTHEKTITKEELAQAKLFEDFRLQINPVMLIFKHKDEIGRLIEREKVGEPAFQLKKKNAEHRLWKISNSAKIEEIIRLFHNISSFYLADGHHRLAAINRFGGSHFMALLVADNEIRLHSFHKLLHLKTRMDNNYVLERVRNHFSVQNLKKPPSRTCSDVVLFLGAQWYKIKPHQIAGPFAIQEHLIEETFKGARVEAVTPTQGIEYLTHATQNSDRVIGIYQPQIELEQVFSMADKGISVPPKSTYFEPKIPNGLISCDL